MSQIPTTPPSGFRDFLPDACAARSRAVETISSVYRSYGFQQIATSAVEDLAVLLGKGGGENEKLIFKLLKRGAQLDEARASGGELADAGLRFDLTLPLARYYSKYGSTLPNPFKAFHIGPVWRAERAQKGRFREFFQCDADIIGSDSPLCEVEVITAILAAFDACGLPGIEVVVNDRVLLLAQMAKAGVPEDKIGAACIALDKLDKVLPGEVRQELESLGVANAATLVEPEPIFDQKLDFIIKTVNALAGRQAAKFSGNLVRGFDYYTGTVFEFRSPSFKGSIGGGGRYDRLTEKFGGRAIPACGGSIGFERLMLLLEEQGEAAPAGPDAVVTVFSDELRETSLRAAAALRRAGLRADLFPGTGKLKKQFQYADSKRATYAVVIGPDEAAAGQANVKVLKTGIEHKVPIDELGSRLRDLK